MALSKIQQIIEKIKPPKLRNFYGESIGILLVDLQTLRIPGDIGNATTYPFPVRFRVVKGVGYKDIVCPNPDFSICQRFIEEAKVLEEEGVRAITTSCGYFSYFQDEIAAAVRVPVFTSSLIQVPLISKILGPNNRIGIICASSPALTSTHLAKAGIDNSMPIAVAGLDKYWSVVLSGGQDPKKRLLGFEKSLSTVAKQLLAKYPDIGAFVFECANFPPGAAAVQEATGLPVFDIVTLTNMIHNVVVRKRYVGYM